MLCLHVALFSDEVVDCVVLIQMPMLFCAVVCMRRQKNLVFFFHLSAELGRKNRGLTAWFDSLFRSTPFKIQKDERQLINQRRITSLCDLHLWGLELGRDHHISKGSGLLSKELSRQGPHFEFWDTTAVLSHI